MGYLNTMNMGVRKAINVSGGVIPKSPPSINLPSSAKLPTIPKPPALTPPKPSTPPIVKRASAGTVLGTYYGSNKPAKSDSQQLTNTGKYGFIGGAGGYLIYKGVKALTPQEILHRLDRMT